MVYDYSDDLAFAQEAIAEFGRPVVIEINTNGPSNPLLPLHGSESDTVLIENVIACFVELSSLSSLGIKVSTNDGVWKEATKVALIAYDGANDFGKATAVYEANSQGWKVVVADLLQPGDTPLLYFVGVKR